LFLNEARAVCLLEPDDWILNIAHSSDIAILFSVKTPVELVELQIAQPGSKQKYDFIN
jgi:hypothetical protein